MSDNFYWITGDSFFIVEAKNNLVQGIMSKDNNFEIKDISDMQNMSDIISEISQNNFMDSKNKIFIFKGELPEINKAKTIINYLEKNIFFLLEEKPNKRTKFYKEFENCIIDFPLVFIDNKIDKEAQDKARKYIKKFTNWEGSDLLFEEIFEYSGYSYGITINEIEKIRILYKSEKNISFKEIKNILFGTGNPDTQKIVSYIKENKKQEAINYLNYIIENDFLEDIGLYVLYSLMENYKFIQACVYAKSDGAKTKEKIAELSSKIMGEEDEHRIFNRLYYYMDLIEKENVYSITRKIKILGIVIKEWIEGNKNKNNLFKNLLISIMYD